MSQRTYETSLYLAIDGAECECAVVISYDYTPAGGDGWHEPRYEAGATLYDVEVTAMRRGQPHRMDLLPILSAPMVAELESRCVQYERECDEEARDQHAEWQREEARDMA